MDKRVKRGRDRGTERKRINAEGTENAEFAEKKGREKKEGHPPRRVPLQRKTSVQCEALALGDWPGGSRGVADGLAVDDQLDAAIALAAFGGVVGGDRLRFAEAVGGDG